MSETGDIYAAFVTERLADQEARKESVERRGMAVVTTSGTLVSLLFGLVAFITDDDGFRIDAVGEAILLLGLVCFVAAAVLGLLTNLPRDYTNIDPTDAFGSDALKQYWNDDRAAAHMRLTATRVGMVATAQTRNEEKAQLLLKAMIAEVVAVFFVAVAVGIMLINA